MEILLGILITLLILIILYLFLIMPRIFNRPDRAPFMGYHYAHRGLFDNQSEAPENSLLAMKRAVEAGYGIELDVQLSKDQIPVVFHDASLKRMTGVDGNVWEYTYEELSQMKLADSDETIPTFSDVLKTVDGKVPLIIEFKLDQVQTTVCEIANQMLLDYKGTYCIECFHPFAVRWYKKNRPDVMRGQLCENYWMTEQFKGNVLMWFVAHMVTNVLSRPDFIAFNHHHASNISRRLCSLMGALPVCWTVKSEEEHKEAKKHFKLIIFDSFIPSENPHR